MWNEESHNSQREERVKRTYKVIEDRDRDQAPGEVIRRWTSCDVLLMIAMNMSNT